MKSFAAIATKYAQDVVDGKIPNAKWVRLACQRHLTNLEQSQSEDYPYEFVASKAERICKFIQCLPHVKGKWAAKSEKIKLQPWQVFMLACLFGWCHKDSGLRRFREAYICVPRKNGKSPIAAGVGLYMLSADGEHGAEVYCGATALDQAMEVFRPAQQMMERSPELAAKLGIQINARSLVIPATGSRFLPVISRPHDGGAPSCGICDELHEAVNSDLYDTFKTGMISREQPLLLSITTAGFDLGSMCYDLQIQAQKVLEGSIEDEQFFAVIYTLDPGDDWTTEAALRKANPNFGISVKAETVLHDQALAVQNSGKQNTFKTKHLCIWCNASSGWMNLEKWNACGDASLKPEDFKDCECFIGMDLASKIDVAALVKVFRKTIDGKVHYFSFPRFYLPAKRTNDADKQHYQKWVNDGKLTATDGSEIDYATMRRDLVADSKLYNIKELAYDPANATDFTQQYCAETSGVRVEVPQRWQYLSEPMKHLEAMVISGRYHHDANPMMTWMMSNVVAHPDANDNLFPRKERNENKIDGVMATLCALNRALAVPEAPKYTPYQRIQFLT
jgi:phage terminase large subunit-like protein